MTARIKRSMKLNINKAPNTARVYQDRVGERRLIVFIGEPGPKSLPHLRAGTIKSYAVTSSVRTASAPEIPTTDEAGLPGFHSATWYGLWAPKGTPRDIIATLNRAAIAALTDPGVIKRYNDQGMDMPPRDRQTPEAFAAYHKSEIEKWWPIIKAAGIKADQ